MSATPPPTPDAVALDLRDHVAFDARRPAYRRVAAGVGLRLGLICLEPKQTLPADMAEGDLLFTVIGGRAWVVVDDAEVTLDPLQAVLVPEGAAYGVRNDSADPLILQAVSSAGADFGQPDTAAPPFPTAAADAPPRPPSPDRAAGTGGSDLLTRLRRLLGSG